MVPVTIVDGVSRVNLYWLDVGMNEVYGFAQGATIKLLLYYYIPRPTAEETSEIPHTNAEREE